MLAPGGLLLSVTCRDAAERAARLLPFFELEGPRVDVWAEGTSAPCPTYTLLRFRRREAEHT